MSQKQPGKGTWWAPMLLELQKLGLKVKNIEGFDYQKSFEDGESYVRIVYRPGTADYYLEHSNLIVIRPLVTDFMEKVDIQVHPANFKDLDELLAYGWLAGIDLNAAVLNVLKRDDYVSHMDVVFGKQNSHYLLHDPGLPPYPNRQISRQKLSQAWFWSGPKSAGLAAVKLNEVS